MSCTSGYTRKYCNKAEQNIDERILGCERVASHDDFKELLFYQCFPPVHSVLRNDVHLVLILLSWHRQRSPAVRNPFAISNLLSTCNKIWLWSCETEVTHHHRHTSCMFSSLESHDVPSSKIHVNSVCLNRWQPEYWIWDCYISYHVNVSSPFIQGLHGK